jgi:hypothetical protein
MSDARQHPQQHLSIETRLTAHTGTTVPQMGFGNVLEEHMDMAVEAALKAGYRHCEWACVACGRVPSRRCRSR